MLVNNAAINIDRTLKNLSTDDWDTVIKADLNSYFYTVRAALPHFMQQKSGKIINISSMNALMGSFGQANYTAAKAGIIGFTKTAALETGSLQCNGQRYLSRVCSNRDVSGDSRQNEGGDPGSHTPRSGRHTSGGSPCCTLPYCRWGLLYR